MLGGWPGEFHIPATRPTRLVELRVGDVHVESELGAEQIRGAVFRKLPWSCP